MRRQDYLNKVKEILINKNPYGKYHEQNFNKYNYEETSPINSKILNNMSVDSKIILTEEVYEMLLVVQDVTNSTNQEFPFFLYGKEIKENEIEFNEFMSSSNNRNNTQASFNQNMINNLESKLQQNKNKDFVVCHGHSHPPIGNFYQNFSLGDFTSYIQMNQENEVFKNKEIDFVSCLVTGDGDINFVFYDNLSDNFYRFTNVFVKDKNNNYEKVNCYGMKRNKNNII